MVTVERLEQYIRDFLSRMHVECLIHGSVNRPKATALATIVEQKLKTTNANTLPLLSRQLLLKREYRLVNQESYRFITENEFHKSSCAELYLQCGMQSDTAHDTANVFIDLVAQILCEPCYNQLRTKEQLGYIVFCASRKANGAQGIRFIVQSAKHPMYVEERIETFLDSMTVLFYDKLFNEALTTEMQMQHMIQILHETATIFKNFAINQSCNQLNGLIEKGYQSSDIGGSDGAQLLPKLLAQLFFAEILPPSQFIVDIFYKQHLVEAM